MCESDTVQSGETCDHEFYVDDMAKSMQYKSDVKCVIDDLKKVLLSRGINLEKYMVNDADLMSGVPVCDRYMGR